MKKLNILLALFTLVAVGTAEDFKLRSSATFRTVDEYKNATVLQHDGDVLVLEIESGIVKVPFTDLSDEVQKKYGWTARQTAVIKAKAAAKNKVVEAEKAEAEKPAEFSLRGKVIQVMDEGLLIDCDNEYATSGWDQSDGFGFKATRDIVLLKGHPAQKKSVDGELIGVVASEKGQFKYSTVLGAAKTVHAYQFLRNAVDRSNPAGR